MIPREPDTQSIEGRPAGIALVVGGAGTLGQALGNELASHNYRVVLADIDEARGREAVGLLDRFAFPVEYWPLDIASTRSWQGFVAKLQEEFAQLDVVVFAAGALSVGPFHEVAWHDHQRVLDVSLSGTIHGCHALLPWLLQNSKPPRLALIASCAAMIPMPWSASYNATKAGLVSFAESLVAEYGEQLSVTVACPAFFESSLFTDAAIRDPALARLCRRMAETGGLPVPKLARAICRAMERGQLHLVVPWRARLGWWLKSIAPSWYTHFVGRRAASLRARSERAIRRRAIAQDSNRTRLDDSQECASPDPSSRGGP